MRCKGKLIKWNAAKAFGFIQPNRGGAHVFIHKTALSNRNRTPQINDIITFSITKDKEGRFCASDASFSGEKLDKKTLKKSNQFSIYISLLFLAIITTAYFLGPFPQKLLLGYFCFSAITFLAYAFDKSKAQRGAWRIKESTLHFFSVIGGWPGAAIAQQLLRHKSQKRKFRIVFWFTVIVNIGGLIWMFSSSGIEYLKIFY
ncbi:MAG: uncharacterized membrane protein YsdA (DUF1294 family)/cold shock CspA family protein [Paraglaciecola sp.]